jgi:hypothetical protein
MYKDNKMSEYFNENRKFFAIDGILGRRDFIINCLIVEIFEALFWTTPVLYIILSKPELISAFQAGVNPIWFSIWTAVIGIFSCSFYFLSITRRIRDIIGEEDNNKIYLISTILSVMIFMGYTPAGNILSGRFVGLFILISLIFWEGKITSQKPKSEIIKFNWGAFLGTWLWGLFNKTPLTLLILPLIFTTGWFPFMLICGLKGNEWAYKKKKEKYNSIEAFHSSQQTQTIIFSIITPILTIICLICTFIGAGAIFFQYTKSNPDAKQIVVKSFKNYEVKALEATFDKIEIKDNLYKFYINPKEWKSDYIQKTSMNNAINYALIKENTFDEVLNGNAVKQYEIMNRVKIYSTFNNEILAECDIDKNDISKMETYLKDNKDKDLSELLKMHKKINESCKYNQSPTLP